MKLLYSDILPLGIKNGQTTIIDCFHEQISNCDGVDIAVGYVSKASLEELNALVLEHNLKHINLIIGMYYIDGMPESTYRTALAINEKWRAAGVGEIRIVRAFKYHGKAYVFHKDMEVNPLLLVLPTWGSLNSRQITADSMKLPV